LYNTTIVHMTTSSYILANSHSISREVESVITSPNVNTQSCNSLKPRELQKYH